MKRPEIVNMIRDIVRRAAPTARTILYGSEARGDARADSDIDLLILMDGEKLSLAQEEVVTLPLYELELKTGVAISPIVMTKYQWENRPFKTPFYVNVMNEGVVL
jgi:predicted nucleotidyltransferase